MPNKKAESASKDLIQSDLATRFIAASSTIYIAPFHLYCYIALHWLRLSLASINVVPLRAMKQLLPDCLFS